jgi:spermidine synthase
MFSFQTRHSIYLALLALGAYSQIAQALLIRESFVVFYGNEISLGAFFGSWLFWIAIGSTGVVLMRNKAWAQNPLPLVRFLILVLPLLLALQIVATRLVRLLLDVSSTEFIPLGDLFISILIITLPTSLGLGIAFPLACKALRDLPSIRWEKPSFLKKRSFLTASKKTDGTVKDVSHLYIFEALGALLGGVLFTFVLIEWLGVWRSLGVVALLLAITVAMLSHRVVWRVAAFSVGGIGLALAATPLGSLVNDRMETLRFATLQPGLELLDTVETRYGHVAVARLDKQVSVVTNGRIAESFPAPRQAEQEAAYFYAQSHAAKRVLLFGGLAGGLAEELLRYPVERVVVIEEDRRAFERIRPFLTPATLQAIENPRLVLHFEDGRRFVNRFQPGTDALVGNAPPKGETKPVDSSEGLYDLVLVLTADPASAHLNRYFTSEFYQSLQPVMSATGVLCTQVSSASNYLGKEVKSYSGSVYRTLSEVFPHIAIAPGDQHVYCASPTLGQVSEEPSVLEQRYLDTPLPEHSFPAESFYSLLPADRIAFVRKQLEEEGGDLNTDAKPVTYYLNMVLWGKFSASEFVVWLEIIRQMGFWAYLVPLVVLVVLMLLRASLEGFQRPRLRRQAATLALTVLGLIGMAVQLALLFSYQAHIGFVFGRIALLNGVFMTGLALGAGGIGQRLTRTQRPAVALVGLMALVAVALVILPTLLAALTGLDSVWQEGVYLLLAMSAGLLTGVGFPLGLHLAHLDTQDVLRSSGLIEAADHLGGALGGLLTGALLVPILGIASTCYLLAFIAVIALMPVLYAIYAPPSLPLLQTRGYRAFPLPLVSWGLAFLVITVFVFFWLARSTESGPTVHFDEATLTAVSQSQSFELREQPIPHYLGTGSTGEGPLTHIKNTVSIASMTVAAEVRGYAGPVNLLVAVDESGILRGVRYIESDETPAYIADIDQWLAKLSGIDVSQTPLTLDNIDALSSATITSRAALESINQAVQAGGQVAFDKTFAPTQKATSQTWLTPDFLITLALLLAFFLVYRSGHDGARLFYQATVLIVLGFWLNTLVTEIDLVNLTLGNLPSLEANPLRYLMIGFVLFTALLFGQAYCGYVCPFGALQEFISRFGRVLSLRNYASRKLETRMRYVKFVLLALMLIAFWLTGDLLWVSFNPMQHIFSAHFTDWMLAITLISLIGALFYYRFWCRYFCPFGAFVALSNKLAFFKRLAPQRRFESCDLGVRDEYDVDCIHCQRCVTGKDFGVRRGSVSTTD